MQKTKTQKVNIQVMCTIEGVFLDFYKLIYVFISNHSEFPLSSINHL